MAQAVFVHNGAVVDYMPPVDMEAGRFVVYSNLIGVVVHDIPAFATGSLAVEGVFDITKATGAGEEIPLGASVYWNVGAQSATKNAAGNKYIGICLQNVSEDAPTVRVLLNR